MTQDRIIFTSELVTDTGTRIKLIVSGKVYHHSYNDVNFFIHRVDKQWKSTELTTGRSLIHLSKTKKQSITDTQRFIDRIKDISGVLSKIVGDQKKRQSFIQGRFRFRSTNATQWSIIS